MAYTSPKPTISTSRHCVLEAQKNLHYQLLNATPFLGCKSMKEQKTSHLLTIISLVVLKLDRLPNLSYVQSGTKQNTKLRNFFGYFKTFKLVRWSVKKVQVCPFQTGFICLV